jgi:hypothetical protein
VAWLPALECDTSLVCKDGFERHGALNFTEVRMIEALQVIGQVISDGFTVGSVAGLCVLEVSLLDGICMIYDKVVHGEKILD